MELWGRRAVELWGIGGVELWGCRAVELWGFAAVRIALGPWVVWAVRLGMSDRNGGMRMDRVNRRQIKEVRSMGEYPVEL